MSRSCVICGNDRLLPLYHPEPQPLSAIGLPKTCNEAVQAPRVSMDFRMCAQCQHVQNVDFKVSDVSYVDHNNMMFNAGMAWEAHLNQLVSKLYALRGHWKNGTVVDIGCGDGLFSSKLQTKVPGAKFVGFEPGPTEKFNFSVVHDYFVPKWDLEKYRPSLIILRHVLEHMEDPQTFIANLSYYCHQYKLDPLMLIEVPCINRALETGRASDFLYEHPQNFTERSFKTLFQLAGFQSRYTTQTYFKDEILAGFFWLDFPDSGYKHTPDRVANFNNKFQESQTQLQSTLAVNQLSYYDPVVLWGGTGKSAAFINAYGFDKTRFPWVVDSDSRKVGYFVPGMGQEILSPDALKHLKDFTIIITTAWRAVDIVADIRQRGLKPARVFVLKDGSLHDFTP